MKVENNKSVFETLYAINCNGHTEKKNNLTYLAWAWAWQMVKSNYPNATYTIYEDKDGRFYHTDGKTCWVKTGVTIEGIEMVEYLPVMDFRNASIELENVTSFDVNKAIQRSLTKACARHGLGLYIYAGEDLPEGEEPQSPQTNENASQSASKAAEAQSPSPKAKSAKTESKAKVSPKAAQAWNMFKGLERVKAMTDAARNSFWGSMLKKASGKVDARELSDGEWDKVIADIDIAAAV